MKKSTKTFIGIILSIIVIFIVFLVNSYNKKEDIITFSGDNYSVIVLEVGKVFDPNIIKIYKDGKEIEEKPDLDLSRINYAKLGKYPITIKYLDKNNDVIYEEERFVEIKDITAPELVLKGSNPITIALNSKYEDAGYEVEDNFDKKEDIKVDKLGTVDTASTGSYTIQYVATDTSGNESQVTRTVIIEKEDTKEKPVVPKTPTEPEKPVDTVTPKEKSGVTTLQLNGANTVYIEYPNTYTELGSTAVDTVDGNISSKVIVSGTVNINQIGTYTITYSVTNSGGKTTKVNRTVIVRDTTAPVIKLKGDKIVEMDLHSSYTESGAAVTDNNDKNIQSKLKITGNVNTNTTGTYYITYTATDQYGNIASIQRKIIVSSYSAVKKVNIPKLVDGMREIKFDGAGLPVNTMSDDLQDISWYDYIDQGTFLIDGKTSRWANTMTNDGSMWVWIPRFAYRITYYTDNTYETISSSATKFGKIQVVFLKGTSDRYSIDGNNYIAKRAGDTTIGQNDYIVHPAFTDERDNNYANGGWDSELTGIWIAKFEAGFAPIGDLNLRESPVTYTGLSAVSNYYGNIIVDNTLIKYPVFKPNAYSYNYISIGDSYALSKALNSLNNPYGLLASTADTHLMKNSEWGAMVYLAHSQYGRNGNQISINNINASDSVNRVNGITGVGGDTVSGAQVISNTPNINNQYNGIYGQLASSTGNVYGIYDISGGLYERTASYLDNGHVNLTNYGKSMVNDGGNINTKYKNLYQIGLSDINVDNYATGINRFGEAIWETSVSIGNNGSWFDDYSAYLRTNAPFLHRGGYYSLTTASGAFAFSMGSGDAGILTGFRPTICPQD